MLLCLELGLRELEDHTDVTLKAPAYILIGYDSMQRSKLRTLTQRVIVIKVIGTSALSKSGKKMARKTHSWKLYHEYRDKSIIRTHVTDTHSNSLNITIVYGPVGQLNQINVVTVSE